MKAIKKPIILNGVMANTTKIQELPNGQLIATIPRALGQALGWKKQDVLVWELKDGKVVLSK